MKAKFEGPSKAYKYADVIGKGLVAVAGVLGVAWALQQCSSNNPPPRREPVEQSNGGDLPNPTFPNIRGPQYPVLEPGYYRPVGENTNLLQGASGALRVKASFGRQHCIEVVSGGPEYAYAAVKAKDAAGNILKGYVSKTELEPAPNCRL